MGRVQRCVRENNAVDVEELRQAVKPIVESVLRNPGALAWFTTLTKKAEYAYSHSVASSVWAVVLGRHMQLGRASLNELALGGMLLDIGKVLVPDEILKQPGPLGSLDLEIVQRHVSWGVELIEGVTGIGQDVIDMVATHHERIDGTGYPNGLSENDIPVYGQIAAWRIAMTR